jgi:hypothetical protein
MTIVLSVSCNTFHELNLKKTRIGMSKHEVLCSLKRDSNLINIIGAKTYGFCRGDIWEYGNYKKYPYRNSKKFMQRNPSFKLREGNNAHYWMAFYNDSLKYVKWGNPIEWKAESEIDSLIVNELRKSKSEKLKSVLKIMKISHK